MSNEQQEHIPVPAPVFSGNIWIPSPGMEGVRIGSAMPVDLAALIRDGKRFRRLEAKHAKQEGSGGWCKRCYEGFADGDFEQVEQPLAEIADALPDPTSDSASDKAPQA